MTEPTLPAEKVNILLVDDRQENLVALSAILADAEYNLIAASSPAQAFSALLRHEVAVILLDVMMPEMDGYEIASLIKEREATRYVPIIFLTAVATDANHIYRGYRSGAVDYLLKPLDAEIVRKKVAVFVDLFRKERRIRQQGEILREMEQREAESRLALQRAEGEAWYSTTLHSIGDAVIATDAQGIIQVMNPEAERLTGWTYEEAKGRAIENVLKIINEETREESENPAVRVIREGQVVGLANHTVLVSRTGEEYVIEDSGAPIRGDNGALLGVVFVFHDTSEKRHEERRHAFLAKASSSLLASLDYAKTFDVVAEVAATTIADGCLIRVRRRDGATETVAAAHRDPRTHHQMRDVASRLPDEASTQPFVREGTQLPQALRDLGFGSCLTTPILLREDHVGTVLLLQAAGRPSFTEADLPMAGLLAERLASSIENSRLYDASQKAVRLRDEFLSIASHELNTPITPLKLQFQNLRKLMNKGQLADYPAEKFDRMLAITERQMDRLSRLVEELLDVSRIGAGTMRLQKAEVDLEAVLGEAVAQFADESRRVSCPLVVHSRPVVGEWDRLRVEQVILNLLANALKFGAGKPVDVLLEADGEEAILTVRDHGIGIAKEDQARIFHRFERAVPARDYPGLGLGLYISRQIVESHGGTIAVESEPGHGSTFVVRLPLQSAAAAPPRLAAEAR